MVVAPQDHPYSQNYHPANEYAKYLKDHGHEVNYCPHFLLIEQCGALAGIDVVAIGKENDQFCGAVIPAHHHESGSVFMTCQKVVSKLGNMLYKLDAEPVTDDEIARLREMTHGERQGVINRLAHQDEREALMEQLFEGYSRYIIHCIAPGDEVVISWARAALTELETVATGKGLGSWCSVCPQAPKDHGPMIRYATASGMNTDLLP